MPLVSFMPLVSRTPTSCYSCHPCPIAVMHAYFAAAAAKRRSPLESTFRRCNGSETARSRTPCAGRFSVR
eukprot:4914025-Lingulodinium_polyedra.AAC.1